MAQEQIPLFYFYFRYKWNEDDFREWQEGMVTLERAMMEGLFNGAVMSGFELSAVSGLTVRVGDGIAIGPSGYLMVENDENDFALEAPTGSLVRKDLIVARPKIVDSDPITRPTAPFDSVPLKQLQDCEILVLPGTPSETPEYAAKGAEDVALAGVRVEAGVTGFTSDDFDFEIRDIYGRNSEFQQNAQRYDDRMRPYRIDNQTLGIKPSQLLNPRQRGFSFTNKTLPSIFPKDSGGEYNHGDTFLDFETGAITGADEASSDFAPTIPAAGQWVVATVVLNTDDTISVAYGTVGTRAQCLDGILSQKTVGAGSVVTPDNQKLLAFVMVKSSDGVAINELEFFDGRGNAATGDALIGLASAGIGSISLPYTVQPTDNGKVLKIDTTAASGIITLPAPTQNFKVSIKDVGGLLSTHLARCARAATGTMIEDLASDYDLEADYGEWNFEADGTDWWLI